MPFIIIIIGAILVIAAFNQTHGDLAHALEQDIPGYFKWGIAIAVILGLGFIPAMKIPSRYLIGLVALVVVLTNWQQMIAGFKNFAGVDTTQGAGNVDPTAAYVQSAGQGGLPTQAQIAGEASGASAGGGGTQVASNPAQGGPNAATGGATDATASGNVVTAARAIAQNPLNPSSYTALISGFGGSGIGI